MLRGWRLRARWPAPIHPELAAHLRAGVSCSYFKFCAARLDRFVIREKKRLREAAARGERGAKASADGARRTSPGRREGARRPLGLALIKRPLGGAPDRPRPPEVGRDVRKGGRSRSVSRPTPSRGGAGQSISRPAPGYRDRPPPPRSDNFI